MSQINYNPLETEIRQTMGKNMLRRSGLQVSAHDVTYDGVLNMAIYRQHFEHREDHTTVYVLLKDVDVELALRAAEAFKQHKVKQEKQ